MTNPTTTSEIYKEFINTGKIDEQIILDISKKVAIHKDLTEYEYAIFCNKINEINRVLIKNKNKTFDKWEF